MKGKKNCPICGGTGEFDSFCGLNPCFSDPDERARRPVSNPRVHVIRNRNHINQNVELIAIYSEAEKLETELIQLKFKLSAIEAVLSK